MNTQSPGTGQPDDVTASSPRRVIDRRRLVAGSLATGVITASAFQIAGAQDDTATPDATPGGTPEATTGDATALAEEALARADAVILSVQADRDAVASSTDLTEVDAILTQASVHRDLGRGAITAGTIPEAVRQAIVAGGTAHASRMLLKARLSYPGLPSQESRSSRALARTFEEIAAVTADAASATDTNVDFFIANAQDLYTSAYDLYGGGAFAQAAGTGRAAGLLARIATLLMVDASTLGNGGMRRGGGMVRPQGGMAGADWPGDLRGNRRGDVDDDAPAAEDGEPVTVPAPEF